MNPKLKPIAAAVALLSVCPVHASVADSELEPVIVTASSIAQKETEATFASEIHTRKMIEKSSAATLYDYLSQHSSINVMPTYGNKAAPMLDMRGFGLGNGYQNIVVSVDGRRLNSIDLSSPMLASIPLATIERIEIIKGSGSVTQGDGATAGAIQIYTRPQNGVSLSSALGTHGSVEHSLSAGMVGEKFGVQLAADNNSFDGLRHKDATGHRDSSKMETQKINGYFNLTNDLRISLDAGHSEADVRYGGSITQAQFNSDPSQLRNAGQTFTHQTFTTDHWRIGGEYHVTSNLTLSASTGDERKRSQYVGSTPYDYDQQQHDLGAVYHTDTLSLSAGIQNFTGTRTQSGVETSKANTALYITGQWHLNDDTTLTGGARAEDVEYKYSNTLSSTKHLFAWDIGVNQRFSPAFTGFITFNQSYLAPDVDRFFTAIYDGSFNVIGQQFNGFIEPAHVKTWTTGLNHLTSTSKTKVALFHARLENEIYLEPVSYTNTNIDKSHKYGLELQHFWKASEQFSLNLNYSYVRAIIDAETDLNGQYAGKELPGVPRHNILATLAYNFSPKSNLLLSQMWRDKAYAANDFGNNFTQRQGAQASTNLAIRHQILSNVDVIASAENIFGHKNGIWIRDNSIYPVSFKPVYKLGVKVSF